MEKLRKAMRLLLVVANLLAIIALLLVGYSDLLQPEAWPKLSNVGPVSYTHLTLPTIA